MKKFVTAIVAFAGVFSTFADAIPTQNECWTLLRKNKLAEAEKGFRAIKDKGATPADRYIGINGMMYALRYQKKNTQVIAEVDKYLAEVTDATNNQKAALYQFKGNAYRDLGKKDEAFATYKAGFELKSTGNTSSDCAKEYIMLALNENKKDLAQNMYDLASKEPASMKNIGFLINSAYLMWKTNQGEQGIKLLDDAEKIKHPAYLDETIHRYRGYLLRDNIKDYEKAVQAFEKALAVPGISGTQKAVLWNNIGMVYEKDEEYEKAVEAFKKVGTFNAKGWFIKSAENSAKRLQKKIDAGE